MNVCMILFDRNHQWLSIKMMLYITLVCSCSISWIAGMTKCFYFCSLVMQRIWISIPVTVWNKIIIFCFPAAALKEFASVIQVVEDERARMVKNGIFRPDFVWMENNTARLSLFCSCTITVNSIDFLLK